MPLFQRIEDAKAGNQALGILVPPGKRTVVIVRPRALRWDLLAAQLPETPSTTLQFLDFDREEAAILARQFHKEAEVCAQNRTALPEVKNSNLEGNYWVGMQRLQFFWIVCPRNPGKPYVPLVCSAREEAEQVAQMVAKYLCPEQDAQQEIYFNTQHFH